MGKEILAIRFRWRFECLKQKRFHYHQKYIGRASCHAFKAKFAKNAKRTFWGKSKPKIPRLKCHQLCVTDQLSSPILVSPIFFSQTGNHQSVECSLISLFVQYYYSNLRITVISMTHFL